MSLPRIYKLDQHKIELDHIDPDAIETLRILHQAGYIAYLVGGSVRDLLLGKTPKDFDICTSATPEGIKSLFRRRCTLIGRRFRLAHIRYGENILEVSTFRAGDNVDDRLITHDNQWGTPEEDASRRDFTINALYYDPLEQTIIDYYGGYEDLQKHQLRTIGAAEARFKQDPVRMIRLLKFKARFEFNIDEETLNALFNCRKEILKSSSARILEEILRMLESSASAPFFQLLMESSLLELLQPEINAFLKADVGPEMYRYLRAADFLIGEKKVELDRGVLISCYLFPMVDELIKRRFLNKGTKPHLGQIIELINEVVRRVGVNTFLGLPSRLRYLATFILEFQYRFEPFIGKKEHHRRGVLREDFPYALQFLYLRTFLNKDLLHTYSLWKKWWQQGQNQVRKVRHSKRKAEVNS